MYIHLTCSCNFKQPSWAAVCHNLHACYKLASKWKAARGLAKELMMHAHPREPTQGYRRVRTHHLWHNFLAQASTSHYYWKQRTMTRNVSVPAPYQHSLQILQRVPQLIYIHHVQLLRCQLNSVQHQNHSVGCQVSELSDQPGLDLLLCGHLHDPKNTLCQNLLIQVTPSAYLC